MVLITGAGSGMGQELARRYAQRGCKVAVSDRNQEGLNQVREECSQEFDNQDILPIVCDVTNEAECETMIKKTIEQFGQLDIMILCAGISAHSLFEEFKSMETFRKVMDVNLYGCVYPTRHAL